MSTLTNVEKDVDINENTVCDYLTCGQCDQEFPLQNITNFIHHKTSHCKQVNLKNRLSTNNVISEKHLSCSTCFKKFSTARGLLNHVQFKHHLNIFTSTENLSVGEQISSTLDTPLDGDSNPKVNQYPESSRTNLKTSCNHTLGQKNSDIIHYPDQEPICCQNKSEDEKDMYCPCRESGTCDSGTESCGSQDLNNQSIPFCLTNQCMTDGEKTVCCNNQECCVTILPGTHETPHKCCNSVLPKKRKLHFVKHMNKKSSKENILCNDKSSVVHNIQDVDEQFQNISSREVTPINVQSMTRNTELLKNNSKQSVPSSCSDISTSYQSNDTNDTEMVQIQRNQSAKNCIRKKKYPTSKPYKCDHCTKAFNQRIHLKKHIMSKHTGVKPFKCNHCDYSTVERSHLKVHTRIHTGEKPFKCSFCDYATAQNSTLTIHLKRRHSGKYFTCDKCGKVFTQQSSLDDHMQEHMSVSPFQDLQLSLNELSDTFETGLPSLEGGDLLQLPLSSNQITSLQEDNHTLNPSFNDMNSSDPENGVG